MANFSVNQSRHLYVVTAVGTVSASSPVGTVEAKCIGGEVSGELLFKVIGADGVLRTDRIPIKNLDYMKVIPASDMRKAFKSYKVSLDPDALVNSKPVVGQDYILRIVFSQFYGPSDAHTYVKEGCVHVTKKIDTAKKFYDAMVESLNLNFSREVGATKNSNPYLTFTSGNDGITITEKEQDWKLGTMKQRPLVFDIQPTTIYVEGSDIIWGLKTDVTPTNKATLVVTGANATGVGNGKQMADLEWFCMGERGDQYRGKGWPKIIPTKYLVDETAEYDALEMHFAFTDTGVNSYRTEKDITFISSESGEIAALKAAIDGLLHPEEGD